MTRQAIWNSLLLCVLWLIASVGSAQAHAELVSSSPAADERLAESPKKINLIFDEELDSAASYFRLVDAHGQPVQASEGRVDLSDPDHVRLIAEDLPVLPEGVYTVHWYAVSADDQDVAEGEFDFLIGNAAPRVRPTPTATPSDAQSPASVIVVTPEASASASSALASWLPIGIVIGVLIVLALMVFGLLTTGKRQK